MNTQPSQKDPILLWLKSLSYEEIVLSQLPSKKLLLNTDNGSKILEVFELDVLATLSLKKTIAFVFENNNFKQKSEQAKFLEDYLKINKINGYKTTHIESYFTVVQVSLQHVENVAIYDENINVTLDAKRWQRSYICLN